MKAEGESSNLLRQRSSMVVFALEQSLGDYLKRCHSGSPEIDRDSTILEVLTRTQPEAPLPRRGKLSFAVAESYFDELLRIAAAVSKGTDDERFIASLAEQVRAVNLFEVRNAVAHPNRDFPENFWHRCAVIATSLPIAALSMTSVSQAFQAALDNKIALPPEDWLNLSASVIPNNLPREVEHDATGLIGRQKERKQLLGLIKARRSPVIVITGPGGLGKTALATQVLREYAQDFTSQPEHEVIVFSSLKEEILTAEGVSRLQVAESIEELKEEIFADLAGLYPEADAQNFESICTTLEENRVLLFVDNLETLLRDAPDCFGVFCDSLPREWSVVATSRVSVDGARTIPLETLSEGDATSLGYRYSDARQIELSSEGVIRLVKSSQCNPLALRLSIDIIAQGRSIDEATRKAASDVVEFSFQNLVSALSIEGLLILECLFVKSPMGRGEMVSLLELSSEVVIENARRLARTSLVRREVRGEDEEFDLNPSVRELLRDSPADLPARRRIQKAIQRQRINLNRHLTILKKWNIKEFSEEFLPEQIPPALGNVLARCIRYVKGEQHTYKQTNSLAKELNEFGFTHAGEWRVWLWLGKLHALLQDDKTAEVHFNTAVEKALGSPVPLMALTDFQCRSHKFKEAKECSDILFKAGFGTQQGADDAVVAKIWFTRLRILLELSLDFEMASIDEEQFPSDRVRACIKLFKAESLIRKVSSLHSDPEFDVSSEIVSALRMIEFVVESGSYQKSLNRIMPFLVKETRHFIEMSVNLDNFIIRAGPLLKVLPKFIKLVIDSDVLGDIATEELLKFVAWCRDHDSAELNARFSSAAWNSYLGMDSEQDSRIESALSEGYLIAKIIRIPTSGRRDSLAEFCFARLESGDQVFVHRDNVIKMDLMKWIRLRVGGVIAVADLNNSKTNKLPVPSRILLI